MEYTNYQQGENITVEGLKTFIRMTDDIHDAELGNILQQATIYIQEYLNKALVNCSVKQSHPHADNTFSLYLTNQSNIQVLDWEGNQLNYTQRGSTITIAEAEPVHITYDCTAEGMAKSYSTLIYQVASAIYDGQPSEITTILKHYPVC